MQSYVHWHLCPVEHFLSKCVHISRIKSMLVWVPNADGGLCNQQKQAAAHLPPAACADHEATIF